VIARVLGLFVVVSVAFVVIDEVTREAPTAAPEEQAGDRIVITYFHGNRRCSTCKKIEAYALEAIESTFAAEQESGRLQWRIRNYEDDANAHLRERYALFANALVLSDVRDGAEHEWLDLDEIWKLAGDKAKFLAYVERETRAMLEAAP